jgi:pyruvate kinase
MIIKKCNAVGKPVIVATQMLESMTENPRPTRAEASDVANAILDGADAVMLSGETAGGKYPIEAIKTMNKICEITDKNYTYHLTKNEIQQKESIPESISIILKEASEEMEVSAIIAPTSTGFTARLVSKHRPQIPIIALTTDYKVMRQMGLTRGVFQFESKHKEMKKLIQEAVRDAANSNLVKKNDKIILVYNSSKKMHTTNAIEIREVKEYL